MGIENEFRFISNYDRLLPLPFSSSVSCRIEAEKLHAATMVQQAESTKQAELEEIKRKVGDEEGYARIS